MQVLLLAALAAFFWFLADNVSSNLAARHIRSGVGFLTDSAGFDISESLVEFGAADHMWRAFVVGLLNTIRVSIISIITAFILGAVVGIMRLAAHPIIRFLGAAHVEVYRNIPLIIQLMAVYLAITELLPMSTSPVHFGSWALLSKAGLQVAVPEAAGEAILVTAAAGLAVFFVVRAAVSRRTTNLVAGLSGFGAGVAAALVSWLACGFIGGWNKPEVQGFLIAGGAQFSPELLAVWVGLTLFTSAAIAEIIRAGVLAVRYPQWEARLALGLTKVEVVSYIIFPQSMRLAIPPLTSQFMNLPKNSSLAVVVGYPDIVAVGNLSINVTGQAIEAIAIIMAVYLVLNLLTSVVMNAVNARVMRAPQ